MSKHSTADQKLHISPAVRPHTIPSRQKLTPKDNPSPEVRLKKTNAYNQYR